MATLKIATAAMTPPLIRNPKLAAMASIKTYVAIKLIRTSEDTALQPYSH